MTLSGRVYRSTWNSPSATIVRFDWADLEAEIRGKAHGMGGKGEECPGEDGT